MNKILLIIQREYLSRVRKKSFIVLTILGPLLIVALYAIPFLAGNLTEKARVLVVVDESGMYYQKLSNTKDVRYVYRDDLYAAQDSLSEGKYAAVLYIPVSEYGLPNKAKLFYAKEQPSLSIQNDITLHLQSILQNRLMLEFYNISQEDYNRDVAGQKFNLKTEDIRTGKSSFIEIKTGLGITLSAMVFMFIFMFGSLVMNGVMEEKTNRIVEVIVSSVRPFQLMMGKIVGVALVGLTQFFIWIVCGALLVSISQKVFSEKIEQVSQPQQTFMERVPQADIGANTAMPALQNSELIAGLLAIDFRVIIIVFLFYFLFGYLFYATLFAAVGSIIESQSDSQQFVLPLTIPLIVSFMMFMTIVNNPSGNLAVWLSMIPITSPVIMLMRIPFGVPVWQICLSGAILVLSFVGSTWLSAKIYRTGILMYGKKISYKELWKWLKYKN